MNVHILASVSRLLYSHDNATTQFSSNSHETDNSEGCHWALIEGCLLLISALTKDVTGTLLMGVYCSIEL
jgi:hypothetical protein